MAVGGFFWNGFVEVPGFTPQGPRDALAYFNEVGDGYFATLGTVLREGRDFGPQDAATAPPVAIVNRAMAKKFFAGQDPNGRQFRGAGGTGPWTTVVGLTADVRFTSLDKDPEPQVYSPMAQGAGIGDGVVFEVRETAASWGSPAATQARIRDLLLSASPAALLTFTTLDAPDATGLPTGIGTGK